MTAGAMKAAKSDGGTVRGPGPCDAGNARNDFGPAWTARRPVTNDVGTALREADFDDSAWPGGPAQPG